MTRLEVIKRFSIAAIAIQLIAGLWQVVTFQKPKGNDFNPTFLMPLIVGVWIDLLLIVPVFIVTLVFMFGDKGNRGHYVLQLVMQVISMVLLPIIFLFIIMQLDS